VEPERGGVPVEHLLLARWVFPVSRPPIRDGALAVRAGAIVGVGRAGELLAAHPGTPRLDLDHAALLPGLVNCHTHLELSGPPLAPPEDCFARWLIAVIGRRQRKPRPRPAPGGSSPAARRRSARSAARGRA